MELPNSEPPKKKHLLDRDLAARLEQLYNDFHDTALRFEEQEIYNTIVFFGSSQIAAWEDAWKKLQEVELIFSESKRRTKKHWDLFDVASNAVYMSRYFDAAEELSMKLATWSKKFKDKRREFVMCSGGGPGIMEATNKGAYMAGCRSIGLTIDIPEEQGRNYYITPELKFNFSYFFLRKFWFFQYARAIIIFPGGLGTLDEFFEILTMIKTKKMLPIIPVVLFGSDYWKGVLNFDVMAHFNTISQRDLDLFHHTDTVDDAFEFLKDQLEDRFMKRNKWLLPSYFFCSLF